MVRRKQKAKILKISILTLFLGTIFLMIAFVFSHMSIASLISGIDILLFFGLPINAYVVLDIAYLLFGLAFFLCVLVYVYALWRLK